MSRHTIRDDAQFEVVVGWDPPLDTLFLQVYDKSLDEDMGPRLWRGIPPDTIRNLEQFRALVTEWAPLKPPVVDQLLKDMNEGR